MCPHEVFYVPNMLTDPDDDSVDLKCSKLNCWDRCVDPDGKRPCWLRRWNEFVIDVTTGYNEEEEDDNG